MWMAIVKIIRFFIPENPLIFLDINLHDVQPDLFHSGTPAQCHARVARHLLVANASGIEAAGQRQHFSALALMLADDFTAHPAMASLLRRTRQGANYLSELDTLPDDFWQARSAA